jgi:TPR repeat protein
LLFNLTAPRSLVSSSPAVSVQLPPKPSEPAASSAPSPAAAEVQSVAEVAPQSTVTLPEVQPQAGVATVQVDEEAARPSEPEAEVAALPPASASVPADASTDIESDSAPPPAPVEETASIPLPAEETAALIRRGDQLLGTGDIVAARSAYERAAAGGNRTAATGVAKTYDPIFLAQSGVRGLRGDPARAALWYAKAAAAGDRTAQQRLRQLRAQYPQ